MWSCRRLQAEMFRSKRSPGQMGKDPHYVRLAIQQGVVKFGVAMKVGDASEFSYYCPDRKVWEETGYFRDVTKEKALHDRTGKFSRGIATL